MSQITTATMFSVAFVLAFISLLQVPVTWGETYVQLDTNNPAVQKDIVNKHNELRRSVNPTASNMLKMSWNSEAAANAQQWADACTETHSTSSKRSISTSGCGENLFFSSAPLSWDDAIQAWFNEDKHYKYGQGPIGNATVGHYTQVVWYRSNEIGCGVAYCPNGGFAYFYVCHYCPPGNVFFKGHNGYAYPYKEGPPCGDCPDACDNGLCTDPCPYNDNYGNCPEIAKSWGCSNTNVADWCPASCKCQGKII
ncbi:serotriflin-like [Alosa sapidissima]|uniref:serotriflin-like n=2 Tax=Alosa TaxID=34772 RepID=UPI001C093055|nr:serotriflin-like [Alosa sapidissima]